MQRSALDLDALTIASPCTVPWASMAGDEVKRFCGQCRLHVHDVSRMTRGDVERLLRSSNRSCCLRLWRRPDGRVITRDCNRVRRALERRVRWVRTAVAALLGVLGTCGCRGARVGPAGPPRSGTPPSSAAPVREDPPLPGARVSMGR